MPFQGKTVRRLMSAFLLAIAGGSVAAANENTPVTKPETDTCAAFPDFKRPEFPMHRISRNIDPDPAIEERQELLAKIGLYKGYPDGRNGPGTKTGSREFLLLYGALFDEPHFNRDLTVTDTEKLRHYAMLAEKDKQTYRAPLEKIAAARLAALRTGIDIADILDQSGTFDARTWTYMVMRFGKDYGLSFHASHIKTIDDHTIVVENPFIERQILSLRDNPRLLAIMSAEALRYADSIPVFEPLSQKFSIQTRDDQLALLSTGFNIGAPAADGIAGTMHRIAVKEFQILYGSGQPTGILSDLERQALHTMADRAHAEGILFEVPTPAVTAIRSASEKGGLEFGYMMELASAESAFSHDIKASTSSATGLYQFIESTWHDMILRYGAKHGLGLFAPEVTAYTDDYGRAQARVDNPFVRTGILEMRKNPHLNARLSADFQTENRAKQLCHVDNKKLGRTDMYLAHFLGAHDGVYFINNLRKSPETSAVRLFPEAAEYNINVFYETAGRTPVSERSLREVFNFFDRKFNRGLYDIAPVLDIKKKPVTTVKKKTTPHKKTKKKTPVRKKK